MRKKVLAISLVLAMLAATLCGCRIGDTQYIFYQKKVNSKTVFSVNDLQCTTKEAKIYFCNYRNIYGNAYGVDTWEHLPNTADLEHYVKQVTLAELSRVFCMTLLAQQQEFALTEEETERVNKAAQEYYSSLNESELEYMDVRLDEVQTAYEHYALAMKLYNTLTEGVNEEVSDDEARVIRVLQIYVPDQETADKVEEGLNNGTDFAAVAATYNKKAAVEVTVARGDYPQNVEDIAYNLEEGTASDMIPASDGFYFVKCISKFEPELTEENKITILKRREKEQFDDQYAAFVESCSFELNDEIWGALSFDDLANPDLIETASFFEVYNRYFEGK